MLIVMEKSSHEEHLSHSLQTNNKQFKNAITFPTGYNGINIVTNKKNYAAASIPDNGGFVRITIPTCADEFENLNDQIRGDFLRKFILQQLGIRLQ